MKVDKKGRGEVIENLENEEEALKSLHTYNGIKA